VDWDQEHKILRRIYQEYLFPTMWGHPLEVRIQFPPIQCKNLNHVFSKHIIYLQDCKWLQLWQSWWTWGYLHRITKSVVSNKTRYPGKKVVVTWTYIANRKKSIHVCSGPELIVLKGVELNNVLEKKIIWAWAYTKPFLWLSCMVNLIC
jgi:hypothetical protein